MSEGRAGIEVNALDSPLARSARKLEAAARVQKVSSVRLGGLSGRRYSFRLNHGLEFRPGAQMSIYEHDVILLGAPNGTLVIRKMPVAPFDAGDADQLLDEAERVIQSFRFQTQD